MVGSDRTGLYTANGRQAHQPHKENVQMKQYKVVDGRNAYRNDPNCEIIRDNDKGFAVNKRETNENGTYLKVIELNPRKFQQERIVNEDEALILMLKGIKVEEVLA